MIAGIVAFAMVMALIAVAFSGGGLLDMKSYVLGGFWEDILAWASFILCLVVPVIALLTWLIGGSPVCGPNGITSAMCSPRNGHRPDQLYRPGRHGHQQLQGPRPLKDFALVQPSRKSLIIRARQNTQREYYDDDWWFNDGWRHHELLLCPQRRQHPAEHSPDQGTPERRFELPPPHPPRHSRWLKLEHSPPAAGDYIIFLGPIS